MSEAGEGFHSQEELLWHEGGTFAPSEAVVLLDAIRGRRNEREFGGIVRKYLRDRIKKLKQKEKRPGEIILEIEDAITLFRETFKLKLRSDEERAIFDLIRR